MHQQLGGGESAEQDIEDDVGVATKWIEKAKKSVSLVADTS